MMLKPVLVIKDTDSTVAIRARIGEDYSEHEIQLSVMLGYYADNDLPVIENLIDLFETVIKRTINDVIPHERVEKTIPTEKKMSFKEFAKQQRELENKN